MIRPELGVGWLFLDLCPKMLVPGENVLPMIALLLWESLDSMMLPVELAPDVPTEKADEREPVPNPANVGLVAAEDAMTLCWPSSDQKRVA